MAPKVQNKSNIKNIDKVYVDLNFTDDDIHDRTWVDTDKSPVFHNDYNESQENSSLTESSEVQFRVKTIIKDIDTKKEETKVAFTDMTTVYGGNEGIKLFLKKQVMESVYKWENSGKEILSMEIQNLYVNRKSVIKDYNFRTVKMYGTVFNYLGYMANAVNTNDCCVPQFIFDTLHNPSENNPRKRIAKLTMKNVIDDLGMQREDEGCCIEQIANFCKKRKVIFYALDYKHNLFETNKDEAPKNNLPRLVFICANNHLYPITNEGQRETLFKSGSKIGLGIKKYKAQQKLENDIKKYVKTEIYAHVEDMSLYGLLEFVKKKCEEEPGDYRIILTQRGSCNALFYEEITHLGNIHNGYVKMNKHNQVMGLKMHGITIDENESYDDIKITMDTLNLDIIKEQDKYKYNGQSIHSLAYAFYTNNYDRKIISKCSPQIHDILISKASINSPLLEFYTDKADIAFDVNKQYTNILMNCDDYGWPIYMPTDEVEPNDGNIETGRYYIETTDTFALEGNGWYCDSVVEKSLK